jgi:hypothetical protein
MNSARARIRCNAKEYPKNAKEPRILWIVEVVFLGFSLICCLYGHPQKNS